MIQIKEEAQATHSSTLLLFIIRYLHTKCYDIIKKEVSLHFRPIRLTYSAHVIEGLTTKNRNKNPHIFRQQFIIVILQSVTEIF